MCVKDEEKGLRKAVESVRSFVDEIIISVDNNSSDSTLQIALDLADVVKKHDFQDDFSKMRNEAQEGAKGDWILFLDGHEFVTKCDNLDVALNSQVDGLLCAIRMENGAIFRNPRLYKNGIKFEGKVHEKLQCKKVIDYPGFVVQHDRINGQSVEGSKFRERQRDDQVPRIFGEILQHDPKNERALFHMGLYSTGTEEYMEAVNFFKRYLKVSESLTERWMACFQTSMCYFLSGKLFRAFWWAERCNWETPGRWEVRKLKGMILFAGKKYATALKYLLTSFFPNNCDCPYMPWPRDDGGTWNLAGECFFNLANWHMAGVAFQRASDLTSDEEWKKIFANRARTMESLDIQRKKS